MEYELYRLDGVLWGGSRMSPHPICPTHKLEMDAWTFDDPQKGEQKYDHLVCEECDEPYTIPRDIDDEKKYVSRKLLSRALKNAKVLNLDGEAIPIAEDKAESSDRRYFAKAILMDSKVGKRLVVYAGERGKKEKTQIFIEPAIKRLAFDQKDLHPTDVFLSVDATFEDGSTSNISRKKRREK